jgi:hypothetical protein
MIEESICSLARFLKKDTAGTAEVALIAEVSRIETLGRHPNAERHLHRSGCSLLKI